MSFRLVPKSVTFNDLKRCNGPYFALFHRIFVYDIVVKQLLDVDVVKWLAQANASMLA